MSKFIGRMVDVGIGRETTRGTGVAPTFWIPKAEFTLDLKTIKARSSLSYGTIAGEGNQAPVAQRFAEGELVTDMTDKSFGLLLYALFGSSTPSGPSDSAYTHTFSISESVQHTSLSVHVEEHDLGDLIFELSMLNSLTLEITPQDVVKVTASFISKSPQASTVTPSYSSTSENKFLGRHLSFKLATDTSGLGAASAISIRRLVLNFQKNVIQDWTLGTAEPEDIVNRNFTITGEVELNYTDRTTIRDLFLDGSYRACRIALTHTALIGATSVPSFTLDLSRVDFDEWTPVRPNDDLATQTFTLHALYDATNGNVVNSCTLVNATASY